MATFQENALFILDCMNGGIVGVALLKDSIKSISTSGGFLYVLSNTALKAAGLVRVAVHYSYVTTESEPRKLMMSTLSTPSTSVDNSPVGSLEDLDYLEPSEKKTQSEEELDAESSGLAGSYSSINATAQSVATVPILCISSADAAHDASKESGGMHQANPEEQVTAAHLDQPSVVSTLANEELKMREAEENELVSDYGVDSDEQDAIQETEVVVKDLLKPSFQSSPQNSPPAGAFGKEHSVSSEWEDTATKVDHAKEQSRRLRMAQASGDDIVANSKSHRRRKKKIKGRNLSSAASEYIHICTYVFSYCLSVRFNISINGKNSGHCRRTE